MTRLKNREPATDLPPDPTLSTTTSANHGTVSLLEDKPLKDKSPEDKQSVRQSAQSSSAITLPAPSLRKNAVQSSANSAVVSVEAASSNAAVSGEIVEKPSRKTSGWRKLGRAIKRHPNVSQTLLFLMLIGGTSAVLLTLLFKGAWSDRYNNVTVLSTILKMELNREDARVLEDSPDRVVTHTFKTLEPHVEADGWEWINRFGNTVTYGRQDQRMIASCSPYSPLYMICDLGEIPK